MLILLLNKHNTQKTYSSMRRLLFILTILATSATAFAQNTVQYWFDQQTSRNALGNATEISTAGLATGIHFAHFQITGSDGLLSPVKSQAFLVMNENLNHSSSYSAISYWFDQQTAKNVYTSGNIDCSALSNGIHTVHFQIIDSEGKPCPVQTQAFVNLDFAAHKLYYWFDSSATRNLMDIDGTEINVSALANGHHTLHAMLADARGNVMSTEQMSANFTIVCPDGEHVDANSDGVCDVCDELVSYTRSTTPERYGTICLPKGATQANITGATMYRVAGKRVDSSDKPTSLVLEEVTDMEAGKPYIFLADAATLNVTYTGDAVNVASAENGLVGSFAGTAVAQGMFIINNNRIVKCGTGCQIGANRAYINMDDVSVYDGISYAPIRILNIEDSSTGIDGIEADSNENVQIYNTSGIRVPYGTKGIMIINGKKVLK